MISPAKRAEELIALRSKLVAWGDIRSLPRHTFENPFH
jgi:hypothetical protein